ncbi:hypothetical protein ACLOJK_031978 [Asimina triloba]
MDLRVKGTTQIAAIIVSCFSGAAIIGHRLFSGQIQPFLTPDATKNSSQFGCLPVVDIASELAAFWRRHCSAFPPLVPLEGIFAPPMASLSAGPAGSVVLKSYVQVVNNNTEHPSFKIPMRFLVDIDGEMGFVFFELEMTKAADDFKYALVMKFMKTRPSIDKIRLTVIIATRFGRYLGTDNATLNRTRASGARICVEVDLTMEPGIKEPMKDKTETVMGKKILDTGAVNGSAQADRVKTTGFGEEENNDRLGNGNPQGEVTTDYSSEREEGEITVLLGKKKLYDTDGERRSTAAKVTKLYAYEENSVRKSQRRRVLWQELEGLQVTDQPWIIVGDFNTIRTDSERIGDNGCLGAMGMLEPPGVGRS